ncbi:MAG: hypothetical protein LBF97_03765, partial [Elusimicrobiota bacterium]|nr:hypothetical protein [Elusimicrobiota bacterium]
KNEIVIENKDSFEIEKAEKMILFLLDYFKIFKEDFYLKARIAFSFKNFKNKAIIEIQSLKDEAGYLNIFTDNNILLGKVILDRSIDNGLKAYPDTTLQNFINLFKLKINFDDINTKINEFNFQEKLSYLKNLLDKSKPQNDLETDTNQFFIESKISNEEIEIYVYKKNDDFNEKELSYKFTFTAEKTLKSFEIIGNCKIYFINYNNYILLKKIEFENEDFFNFINIIDFKFLN